MRRRAYRLDEHGQLCDSESALVDMALAGTTNHVERIVSAYRWAESGELAAQERQHERRSLQHTFDSDGTMAITIRVPAEAGAVILSAVERFVAPAKPDTAGVIEPLLLAIQQSRF